MKPAFDTSPVGINALCHSTDDADSLESATDQLYSRTQNLMRMT